MRIELMDRLGAAMFDALRKQPATATERWQAIMRMGRIAEAYKDSGDDMIDAVFGSVNNFLEHDRKDNSIRDIFPRNGAH